jgi:hypothetical protein
LCSLFFKLSAVELRVCFLCPFILCLPIGPSPKMSSLCDDHGRVVHQDTYEARVARLGGRKKERFMKTNSARAERRGDATDSKQEDQGAASDDATTVSRTTS